MNPIQQVWKSAKEKNKVAFIPYITAGYPSLDQTIEQVHILEESGADIIELGIPFSDPTADGPVLQQAAQQAINNGFTLVGLWQAITAIRQKTKIPLVLLVYYNTIYHYGIENFTKQCKDLSINGLIIPDLPVEEQEEISPYLDEELYLVPLVAPTSKKRIAKVIENAKGYIYYISSLGVTGVRSLEKNEIASEIEIVRKQTTLPIAVGFGISTQADIDEFSSYVDGIIIGTAIVQHFEKGGGKLAYCFEQRKD